MLDHQPEGGPVPTDSAAFPKMFGSFSSALEKPNNDCYRQDHGELYEFFREVTCKASQEQDGRDQKKHTHGGECISITTEEFLRL
jgi:hypothetical protein